MSETIASPPEVYADEGEPSRRQLLIGGGLITAGLGLQGCTTPGWEFPATQADPATVSFWFRRAEDQIELKFTFFNARFATAWQRPYALRRVNKALPLLAKIEFPSQHVLERAFFEDAGNTDPPVEPPVKALLSDLSRLVFEVPVRKDGRFPLTEANLLNWTGWMPRLVPAVRDAAAVAPPGPLETSIELPSRLVLSPGITDRWSGSPAPLAHDGWTELWHTRLIGSAAGADPTVRAVWSPDFKAPGNEDCFLSSLTPGTRQRIVTITHVAGRDPQPITPKVLALSSMGGWLDLDAQWEVNTEHLGLISSWKNRTTMGRDQFVQVEYPAVLYPSGFFVTVVETTERKLEASPSGKPTAYLRKRITIKFNELLRTYAAPDMPFAALAPKFPETPPLDMPRDFVNTTGGYYDGAFWPLRAGADYEFPFIGTDHDGNPVEFNWPQICIVGLGVSDYATALQASQTEYATTTPARRTRTFSGQPVAVSASEAPGHTVVQVDVMEFEGKPGVRVEMPPRRFEPAVARLCAWLGAGSATKAIPAGPPAWFTLYDTTIATNTNRVFLLAAPNETRLKVDFTGDTTASGGFVAPKFTVAGVSAINGPFGGAPQAAAAASEFVNGTFDPRDFFPRSARILGGVSFADILTALAGMAGERAPAIVSRLKAYTDAPHVISHSLNWATSELRSSPKFGIVDEVLLVQSDAKDDVPYDDRPTSLSVVAQAIVPLRNPAGAHASFDASLDNFCIQLALQGEGVRLKVRKVTFSASSNSKPAFNIDIEDYRFTGSILSIVQKLQETLGLFGDDSPIDITPQGVTLHLPSFDVPPLECGFFNLLNLRIRSSAYLPFNGAPIELHFSLSTALDPFVVSVGPLSGVGHFNLVLDTFGIKHLEASLAFGAFRQFEVGGVLKGRAFILGGFVYTSTRLPLPSPDSDPTGTTMHFQGFVHLGGSGTVLGFLSVGVDCHIALVIQDNPNRLYGYAILSYSYKVGFFSKKISVKVEKTFSGAENAKCQIADTRAAPMSLTEFAAYRAAFAEAA